jgi:hypothetical protein
MKSGSGVKSPMKYWLNWKGDTGVFVYWDGEKNVELKELEFLLLDRRITITGWSDTHSARIFSNAVSNLKEELNVRAKGSVLAKGLYADIKEKINAAGGNFTVNLYAMAKLDGKLVPVCIQLDKGCLKEWSDFLEVNQLWKVYKGVVKAGQGPEQKKGKVTFRFATFALTDSTPELDEEAKLFDVDFLQPYFNGEAKVEHDEEVDDSPPFK